MVSQGDRQQREEYQATETKTPKTNLHLASTGKIQVENEELVTRMDKTFVRRRKMWVRPHVAERINKRRKATDWVRALGNYVPMYFVGEFVRDRYLGKVSKNVTVMATGTRGQVKEMINRLNINYKNKDDNNDIFVFDMDDITIELTPIDAQSLVRELADKPFTVDAIAQSVTGQFYDPFKGLNDLHDRVLRTPYNSSDKVFKKNPLAILEAAKYVGDYQLEPHPSVLKAIPKNKDGLKKISPKKIGGIFSQIMMTSKPYIALEFMKDQDLLKYIHPSLEKMVGVKQKNKKYVGDVWEHTMTALKAANSQDLGLNLAILLHDIGKPSTSVNNGEDFPKHADKGADITIAMLSRLQFDKDVVNRVANLVRCHEFIQVKAHVATSDDYRKLKLEMGEDIDRLVSLARADCDAYKDKGSKHVDRAAKRFEKASIADPEKTLSPLNDNEIMEVGEIQEGPIVSEIRKYLHNKVVYGKLSSADKRAAAKLVRGYINRELIKSIDDLMVLFNEQ